MIKSPLQISVFFVLAILMSSLARAELIATITPRIVDEMETVRLTLRMTDTRRTEKPDLTPLDADFEVLGTQTSSQYHSINGRVESFVEYQINLRPKRSGQILVPSINIGGELSRPLNLSVRTLDPGVKRAIEKMVFFETEVSPNPVYVQAQTVLTRRLLYSNGVQIYSDLPGIPEVPDAVVLPLGDTRSMNILRDGQRYGVIEQRFAIYPESSGTLIIPEIAVTSSVRVQSGDRIRRSGVRIGTEAISVEVLPVPANYPADQPWLPVADIRMVDTWSPSTTSYATGDPVTRKVLVLATDNVGSAIPPLGITLPETNFRLYPETPVLNDDHSGETVIGARVESYSIIPTRPGLVFLPPVQLTWWDTKNEQVRVSQLAGVSVDISGTETATTPAPSFDTPISSDTNDDGQAATQPDPAIDEIFTINFTSLMTSKLTLWLLAISLSLGFAWLLVYLKKRTGFTFSPRSASGDASAWAGLKRACKGDDLHEIRSALTSFLMDHYQAPGAIAMARFESLQDNRELMQRLNMALYGAGDPTVVGGVSEVRVSGAEVLAAVKRVRIPDARIRKDPLPALYAR